MANNSDARLRIQNKIRDTIPQSESMQFSIVELKHESIIVNAPLSKNYNIHGTGFAGSIYSIGILTGWALCYHVMESHKMIGDLVVGKAEIIYKSPLKEDILCSTSFKHGELDIFCKDFKEKGKSAVKLDINIGESGNAVLKAYFFAKAR